jgi:hypothetical protein
MQTNKVVSHSKTKTRGCRFTNINFTYSSNLADNNVSIISTKNVPILNCIMYCHEYKHPDTQATEMTDFKIPFHVNVCDS